MDIKLNDILHLSDEEIENSKIGLNMAWQGRSHFLDWYESDVNNRNVDFTYHSHQGSYTGKKKPNRNFTKIGQKVFGFVRLEEDDSKWLLVSAGEITSIPDHKHIGTCGHKELPEYQGLVGRLIIKYHKGNTFSRYVFDLKPLINKIVVAEILPNIYEPIKFKGYENVHLNYKTLKSMLEGSRYNDYRAALKGVKGIYCLTDMKTKRFYIGGTYGEDGVLQRWTDYKRTFSGGNVGLDKLLKNKGEKYFEENFRYTLLETFPKNIQKSKIEQRENYWKEVFNSRSDDFGYNKN